MKSVALFTVLLASCGQPDSNDNSTRQKSNSEILSESRKTWDERKPELYSYTVSRTYGIDWDHPKDPGEWSTIVVVNDNKVICRAFKQTGNLNREYIEKGDTVGSHDFGFEALTLDVLYSRCADLIESKPSDLMFYLDEKKLIKSCFTWLTTEQQNKVRQGIDHSILIKDIHPDVNKCDSLPPNQVL